MQFLLGSLRRVREEIFGSVIDPYVLEGEPAGLFNRAAMKSIRKWIYEPSTYDGVPVQVNDVQVRINFNLTAIE